jgi:predicted patatin/cPLA2 family phospholipase
MERDIILIIEGGAMSGVFAAGVLTSFYKKDLYPRIHSIYAVSAGAHDAAYFLSKQVTMGSEVYTKTLVSKRSKFLNMDAFEMLKKVTNLLLYKKSLQLIDLEVLKDIETIKHKLDVDEIKRSKINFYVKVYDTKHLRPRLLDAKKNTIDVIEVSSFLAPYIYLKTNYDNLYDGEEIPNDYFIKIVKENPDKKIIWIMNEKKTKLRKVLNSPFTLINLFTKSFYFGVKFFVHNSYHLFEEPCIDEIQAYSNVTVIYPEGNVRRILKYSSNKKHLSELYQEGVKKGKLAI